MNESVLHINEEEIQNINLSKLDDSNSLRDHEKISKINYEGKNIENKYENNIKNSHENNFKNKDNNFKCSDNKMNYAFLEDELNDMIKNSKEISCFNLTDLDKGNNLLDNIDFDDLEN